MEQKVQKVLVVTSVNLTPEDKLAKRLARLRGKWRVISATTNLVTWGKMDLGPENSFGSAKHVYYVTTVIVEK